MKYLATKLLIIIFFPCRSTISSSLCRRVVGGRRNGAAHSSVESPVLGPGGCSAPTEERIEFCFLLNVEPWPVKALVSPRILGMLLRSFVR